MYATRSCFRPSHLVSVIHSTFHQFISEQKNNKIYSDSDCVLSAFAMFHLKYPSLLQFQDDCRDPDKIENIKSMYKVKEVPSDTTMRERLDPLETGPINEAIHDMIGVMQRSQSLQEWDFLGTKLIGLDGTGFFSSHEIHCKSCCEKKSKKDGSITYHHQMLVGSIVSPYQKQVFPVLFEPICNEDGAVKNDCERNAAKRWLKNYRTLYPNMPTTIVEDGLSSNAPHIRALQEARCHFILGAKQDDHQFLYDWFFSATEPDITELTETKGHFNHRYRFMNNVPLNDSNFDLKVNVLMFEEEELPHLTQKGKQKKKTEPKRRWVWITDYTLSQDNIRTIAQGGRARWKIENETFNTLKNQGYHLEHNYGHGYKNLSNVLAGIMLLAFLFDQILFAFNAEMKKAFDKTSKTYRYLWEKLRSLFDGCLVSSLEALYQSVFQPPPKHVL